jgi:hypothetical protein
MKRNLLILASLVVAHLARPVVAKEIYASPTGNGNGSSASTPMSLSSAASQAQAGDTVYLASGTYSGLRPGKSGTADAWITFAAAPGALPIIEGGNVGSGSVEYVRYVGIVARNGSSGGFGNGWTNGDCNPVSNGNLEYINCVADGNAINGIAHYCAGGLRIKQSIVAHNGNKDPSWSSGVNLFGVQGGASSNIVEQTLSFENIDISSNHSDGSGFIADQNSQGASFINNIGFRNGGSCIRITNSTNTQIINNTCVNDGQDPSAKYHDEIFFSDTGTTHQGALLRNNLCIPTSGQKGLTMGDNVTSQNNNFSGTASLIVSATGDLDFHLVSGSAAIDAGASGAPTPADEIGFDWRCIKQQTGQAVSWWAYAVDYDYIQSIGGVAACFQSGARGETPDQGAYEFGASPASGTGGTPSAGGGPGAGGTSSSTGGSSSADAPSGGASSTGVTPNTGGTLATGGATSVGGGPGSGGTPGAGGVAFVPSGGASGLGTGGAAAVPTGGAPVVGTGGAAPAGTGGDATSRPAGGGATPTGGSTVQTGGRMTGGTSATVPTPSGGSGVSTDPSSDDGCGCSVVGSSRSSLRAALGSLLGALMLRRRRRGGAPCP